MITHLLTLSLIGASSPALAAEPTESAPAVAVTHLQPFTLEAPHDWRWGVDRQPIAAGVLFVASVDPELARPRQVESPVLYADADAVERLNGGYPSGCVVGIIPGERTRQELEAMRLYFGAPGLPERLTRGDGQAALEAAIEAGVQPVALAPGWGEEAPTALTDIGAVFRLAAPLLTACSPDEVDLAAGWLTIPE